MGLNLVAKTSIVKPKKTPKPKKPVVKAVAKPKLNKTPKPKKAIVWTEARKKSFVVSVLRSGTQRWPPKYECLADAYVGQMVNKKTGRIGKHYRCAMCGEVFPSSEVNVNHIEPVVSIENGFTTWDDFIERLFCVKELLNVLCKPCHDVLTKEENEQRRRNCKTT